MFFEETATFGGGRPGHNPLHDWFVLRMRMVSELEIASEFVLRHIRKGIVPELERWRGVLVVVLMNAR